MKTESSTTPPLVLMFSEKARGFLHEHELTLNDGTKHTYMTVTHREKESGRPPIIPYFHDGQVVAEVNPSDVKKTSQGTFGPIGGCRVGDFKPKAP